MHAYVQKEMQRQTQIQNADIDTCCPCDICCHVPGRCSCHGEVIKSVLPAARMSIPATTACRSRYRSLFSPADPAETGFEKSLPRRCAHGESVQSRRFFASMSSNTTKIRSVPMVNRYSRDVSLHR